jgi:YfiH family protein
MPMLRADNLKSARHIAHGFFTRKGGVSTGIFASLNCGPGSGDERDSVNENRRRVAAELGDAPVLLTLYQVHSPQCVVVTAPWAMGEGPKADAMATNLPDLALGILTADCAPLLFADGEAGVIGAAHAGWKGALGGVVEATIAAMETLGALRARIAAAIGPCISQTNYEVGPEFRDQFAAIDSGAHRFFAASERPGHFRFDLEGYAAARLEDAGIRDVARLGTCTYANEADFFSYRRATHRGEKDYGRQISAIMLTT